MVLAAARLLAEEEARVRISVPGPQNGTSVRIERRPSSINGSVTQPGQECYHDMVEGGGSNPPRPTRNPLHDIGCGCAYSFGGMLVFWIVAYLVIKYWWSH